MGGAQPVAACSTTRSGPRSSAPSPAKTPSSSSVPDNRRAETAPHAHRDLHCANTSSNSASRRRRGRHRLCRRRTRAHSAAPSASLHAAALPRPRRRRRDSASHRPSSSALAARPTQTPPRSFPSPGTRSPKKASTSSSSRCRTSNRASWRPSRSRMASASSTSVAPGACSTRTNRAIYKLHDAEPDCAAKLQAEAVYGLPELHAHEIKSRAPRRQSRLLRDLHHPRPRAAPPGRPGRPRPRHRLRLQVRRLRRGQSATANTHFMHAADNLSAYAVFGHRHTGELLEQLQLTREQIQFTPHLLPIPRGILSTHLRSSK